MAFPLYSDDFLDIGGEEVHGDSFRKMRQKLGEEEWGKDKRRKRRKGRGKDKIRIREGKK